jgi:transcriptional regulator with GAF, ATPase, and Fis domain
VFNADSDLSCRLIGESEPIRRVTAEAMVAATLDAPVLLVGEPGTGTSLVARWIHQRSRRAAAPLVTLNCSGLPDFLFESELFGHLRGSFPGAYRDKPGLLELAPDGTLFLDRVAEMSATMQAMLIDVLRSGEIRRAGADFPHARVNFRLIAAAEHDLDIASGSGPFDPDLSKYFGGIRILLPPLRERAADIPILVECFLDSYRRRNHAARSTVAPEAMDALIRHRWPGNLRELKHVVERAVHLAKDSVIRSTDLPADITRPVAPPALLRPRSAWSAPGSAPGVGQSSA